MVAIGLLKPEQVARQALARVAGWKAAEARLAAKKKPAPAVEPPNAKPISKEEEELGWMLWENAKKGSLAEVKRLLKAGAYVDAMGKFEHTGTMSPSESVRYGNGKFGHTALMVAAWNGHTEVVKFLIANGANVNATTTHGLTALMNASTAGHVEAAKLLIDAKADMDAKNKNGNTALMKAVRKGHAEVAKLLIENGASLDARGWGRETALIMAVRYGQKRIVELLIAGGADVNDDGYGATALTLAVITGQKEIAELLRARGATE